MSNSSKLPAPTTETALVKLNPTTTSTAPASDTSGTTVHPLVAFSLAHKHAHHPTSTASLAYKVTIAVLRRLDAIKDALVQSSQPNGPLEPLIQLLNLSQLHGILLAYLPESPLGHRLRTNIYAVDMFVTSVLVTGSIATMSTAGTVLRSLWSPTLLQSDSVSIKIEYYRLDVYGEQMVNTHYKALSWLISNASRTQTGGDFRMVAFESDTYNDNHNEGEDDESAGPPFNILPRGDSLLTVNYEDNKFQVFFDQSGDSGEGKKDDNRGWSSSRTTVSEPPIVIHRVDSGPTDIAWMHQWLMSVTKAYLKEEKKNKVRARWEMRETYWARVHSLHSNRGLSSVALDQPQEELLKRDLETFLADREFYARIGLPYRRGYLFSGKPGTGKTSLINALSATFDRDLYYINLKDVKDDNALQSCFSTVPKNSIIVFEDIDAQSPIVHTREKRFAFARQAKQEKKLSALTNKSSDDGSTDNGKSADGESDVDDGTSFGMFGPARPPGFGGKLAELLSSVSLSTLLNCLDGYAMHEGTIIIMTSNHPEVLDPALVRPGRIDTHLELGYCTHYQLQHMYKSVLDDQSAVLADITMIPEKVIPPCEALRIMVLYRSDAEKIGPQLKLRAGQLLAGAEPDAPEDHYVEPTEIVIPKKSLSKNSSVSMADHTSVPSAPTVENDENRHANGAADENKSSESDEDMAVCRRNTSPTRLKMVDSAVLVCKMPQMRSSSSPNLAHNKYPIGTRSEEMNHFQSLPCELVLKILVNVGLHDKFKVASTCRLLRYISRDPILYKDLTIPSLSPLSLTKLLDALSSLQVNLSSLYINDTNPKLLKMGRSPPALDYLGLNSILHHDEDESNHRNKENNHEEVDSRVLLNSIISFLIKSNTDGLGSLVVCPALWSGCQTDKVLEGLRKFGGRLKHLRLPTQGQLFSDTFIHLTLETPLVERVSGILWTPTARSVMSIATCWKNLKILEIADDHAGYEISSALAMVFCQCRQLEVVRIHQVVPDDAGWKLISKIMDEYTTSRKPITRMQRSRSYMSIMNHDDHGDVDDDIIDEEHYDDDEEQEDEDGDLSMKDVSSSPSRSTASSSSSLSSTTSCTTSQPISADRVRFLEVSILCYCRNAPRILSMDTCRILQRIFPGVRSFRYHYEGALRGADVESTRVNLNEFASKWVGKNGSVDIVC
ncbi:hypothetical protein SeLEV6574_g01936 [Synchytrium endobioticum]|nr:hypothetical protein SeLEV6574_g01936 [Synchytrium endobioticum]